MIVRFNNNYLEELYKGEQKGKPKYSEDVVRKFKKTISILKNVESSKELSLFHSLNFEHLEGTNNPRFYSVRVDIHYRLIFELEDDLVLLTEIVFIDNLTNHYQ